MFSQVVLLDQADTIEHKTVLPPVCERERLAASGALLMKPV